LTNPASSEAKNTTALAMSCALPSRFIGIRSNLRSVRAGLYATSQSYITPDAFIANLGIYFFVAIIIGGRGVIIGPFIGAAVLAAIPELVGPPAKYGTFFYGFILLTVVLVLPGGFGGLITGLAAKFRHEPQVSTSIGPELQTLRVAIRACT
jgi:branched-chain amino acid transport system permease protein